MTPEEHIMSIKERLKITKEDDGYYTPLDIECDGVQVLRFGPASLGDDETLLCCADLLYGYGCRAEDDARVMQGKVARAQA